MEKVPLNNVQLHHLASADTILEPHFYGTVACDRLPRRLVKKEPRGYIMNTDPHDRPGKHWLALWTHSGSVGEVMDSYALPLDSYEATEPLKDWLKTPWKYVVKNGQSLQSIYSKSCSDYASFYLKDRARGQSMNDYLSRFSKHDYVDNDHKVGQMLKKLIVNELTWHRVCKLSYHQCNSKIKCCYSINWVVSFCLHSLI